MRNRSTTVWMLAFCAGLLLAATPAWGQVFEYEFPEPIPFYGGQGMEDILAIFGEDAIYDVTLQMPDFLYRPLDNLATRPGAQALGMGGAHLAQAEGALALGWNPAGMAGLEDVSVVVDGFVKKSGGSATLLPDTIMIEGLPEFGIDNYEDRLGGRNCFGFVGAAAPLFRIAGRPVVGGVAHRRHTEVAYGEEVLIEMSLLEGQGFPLVVAYANDERGSIESFTMGLAYEALHMNDFSLSLGGSANFLRGRLRSEAEISAQAQGTVAGYNALRRDYSGFSLEFGAKAQVSELVRLGGWVGLPYTLEVSNSKFSVRPIMATTAGLVVRIFGEVAPYDIEVPLFASAGVAVGPIKGISVAADLNHRPWSEAEIKHHVSDYAIFDGAYPAADVTSVHLGSSFEFPFFRPGLHDLDLRLDTHVGYRTLPLAMYELDLLEGSAPYYLGDQVEGSAFSLGFSLATPARISFHLGLEFQSYSFRKWFMNDARPLEAREMSFTDPWDRAPRIDRSVTVLRFSSEMHL